MSTAINEGNRGEPAARALAWLVKRDRTVLDPTLDGRPAAAFNLAILTAMLGTPWVPDLTDHVLYIEEVSEQTYSFDRMMFQLANATQLKGIAGIRLGAVSDVPDNGTEAAFGETFEEIMHRWCRDMGVPYLGRARIGHVTDNHIIPFGIA
jgi:muramoyltetrapeptide carboxypeptidase